MAGSVAMNPVVLVHGGASSEIPQDLEERLRQGVVRAATAGYKVLKEGGRALDAVEAAVTILEDDPEFNAGHGAVLNAEGTVEMDASIMDGRDLSSGAVCAARCIANPIQLARLVMEKTPHCLLTSHGAAKFACAMGVPVIPGEQLITERNRQDLEKEKQKTDAETPSPQKNQGTVGAVALDSNGDVAYATSTGGLMNKMVGRVGDSPCVGSGGYADSAMGAVSSTGHGESILKVNLARLILFHVQQGKAVGEAADTALGYMKSKVKGEGGVIVVSNAGDWAAKWTTESMPWAAAQDGKVHFGLHRDEARVFSLP
ncbi:isoaspartyl peptidase/L-asparaginase-like [Molossus molossus]|uniref:isoaspartyl peptidase/L-asparaginase-like n=1 Tax=Molossus molossus TaxID=27622 RepID=UPI0017473FFD|nr:isoaspartyl peptidase/L-asparaginase-like [Molossus molossus]XP_036116964.1 isoaspartyl peptidase/L-asparaginase-like [Molossus molossus]